MSFISLVSISATISIFQTSANTSYPLGTASNFTNLATALQSFNSSLASASPSTLQSSTTSLTTSLSNQNPTNSPFTSISSIPLAITETLPIFMTFPAVTVSTASDVSSDGHGTSTGPNNRPTVWPVIAPGCFFCPPGIDSGLMLVGLISGIYPEGLRLPEFPDPLPRITIGDDHNPTYTSSATTRAENPTGSDKLSTIGTTSAEKTSAFTSTNSKSTTSSRSSLPSSSSSRSSSATTSSSTKSNACPTFAYPSLITFSEAESTTMSPGRLIRRKPRRRTKKDGFDGTPQCNLVLIPFPKYPQSSPELPAGPNLEAITAARFQPAATFWYLMVRSPQGTCGAWQIQKVDDVTSVNDPQQNQPYVYGDNTETNKGANVDHVYEKKLISLFFQDDINEGMARDTGYCNNWKGFWEAQNPASNNYEASFLGSDAAPWSRIFTMIQLVAASRNPAWADVAGVALEVNLLKGHSGITKNPGIFNKPAEILDFLNTLQVTLRFFHTPEVSKRFSVTNQRIYAAFQEISRINCGSAQFAVNNYADRYSSFMTNYMSTQGATISNFVSSIVATLLPERALVTSHKDANGVVTSVESTLADKLAAITAALPLSSFTLDGSKFLTWPGDPDPAQTIALQKRDTVSKSAEACNLAFSSSSKSRSIAQSRSKSGSQSTPQSTPQSSSPSTPPASSLSSSSKSADSASQSSYLSSSIIPSRPTSSSARPITTFPSNLTPPSATITAAPVPMSYGVFLGDTCVQEGTTIKASLTRTLCLSWSTTYSSLTSWPASTTPSRLPSDRVLWPCLSLSSSGSSTSCVLNTASILSLFSVFLE